MNVILADGRTRVLRLLTLAAVVAVLLGGSKPAVATGALATGAPGNLEAVVASVHAYWKPQLAAAGRPGWGFRYWISNGAESTASACGVMGDPDARPGVYPAAYCRSENAVYLSSSWLFNHTSSNGTTPYGTAVVVAHEVGHAVQAELGLFTGDMRMELQADCFAGAWMGQQVRSGQASGKDVRDAQIQVQSTGDYEFGNPAHHGTADQRAGAWATGVNGGPGSCGA